MMNCSDFNRFLDNYENLGNAEIDEMNNHALSCENCRNELEFFKSIMLTAASLPVPEPPADLIDKINSRIDNIPKRTVYFDKAVNSLKCHARRYAFAAACAAVGIVVGLNGRNINNMLNPVPDTTVAETVVPTEKVAKTDIGDTDIVHDDMIAPQMEDAVNSSAEDVKEPSYKNVQIKQPVVTASGTPNRKQAEKTVPETKQPVITAEPVKAAAAAAAAENTAEKPAETQAPVTNGLSRYTIARDNYHIPTPSDDDTAAEKETPVPDMSVAPSEKYQIAMGNYDIPEGEKKSISNKLVVSEADISEVTECMRAAGIKGVTDGYEAAVSDFRRFIAMLDSRGINYNYAEANNESSKVSFVLLAN